MLCQQCAHTINIAGERFQIPTLHEFTNLWNSLFAHSAKVRLCWKEQCGSSALTYSPIRQWSKFEVMNNVMVKFGDVQIFVSSHSDISPATQSKLLSILSDPQDIGAFNVLSLSHYSGYDPSEYNHLQVSKEINELFGYITRYTSQNIELECRLMPFVPEYVPAIGDIDAFIKVC